MLHVMIEEKKGLGDLLEGFTEFPQVEKNVWVREKKPVEDCPGLTGAIQGIKDLLGDDGRVVVRYSGTDRKVRVMVEGVDAKLVDRFAEEIAEAARKELGGD